MKTYRDLSIAEVEDFADIKALNIESEQNYKEAAKMLFENKKKYEIAFTKMYEELMKVHESPEEFNKKYDKWIKENAHKYGISTE